MAGLNHIRKRNEMELGNISKQFDFTSAEISSTNRNKIKYGNTSTATWGLISEYCQNSSIHGVKYLGEQKRSLPERLFWILIFAFSIYGCLSLIGNTWEKWSQNPVIVSFNEKSTPVWEIPFPAITICPEFKFPQDKYNFTNVVMKLFTNLTENSQLTEKESYYTEAVAHICDYEIYQEIFEIYQQNTIMFKDENKFTNLSVIISILEELQFYNDAVFDGCTFQAKKFQCKDIFQKILTKEGVCFTFNKLTSYQLHRDETVNNDIYLKDETRKLHKVRHLEWNLEDGYSQNANKDTYPRRSLASGSKAGLFLYLSGYRKLWDKLCRGPILGYKLLLHSPDEIDDISSQYIQVPLGQQILISMKPKILHTSQRLRHYKPETRQCFFQNERYLRYFKYYNQKNCQLECLTNFTLSECGCVRFDMPRNNDTPICGLQKLNCYNKAENNILNQEFQYGWKQKTEIFNSIFKTMCNCLPACISIAYETEITQADYNFITHFESFIPTWPDEYKDVVEMSRLFIFFKEPQFLTSKRSELYGTTDFLANCGGLLGLFMGVSLLSLVEMVYFCTIRLVANLKMRRKVNKSYNKKIVNYDDFE